MGKFVIAFFAFLTVWLLWRSVVQPLLSIRAQQKIVECISWTITSILLGIFAVLLIVLLQLLGLGFIELIKMFGLEKIVER